MNSFDTVKRDSDTLPPELEAMYGTPESTIDFVAPKKCDHYFVRKSATVFGCRDCGCHWIDNGEFQFTDGKYSDFIKRPQ